MRASGAPAHTEYEVGITSPKYNKYMWQQWVNLVLGLAIIASPFVGLTGASFTWTLVVGGALVAILALWGALREQDPQYHQESLREIRQS